MTTIEMIDGLQWPAHPVAGPTAEATVNSIESGETSADAVAFHKTVYVQDVAATILPDPLAVSLADALPRTNSVDISRIEPIDRQQDAILDAIPTGGRSPVNQEAPSVPEGPSVAKQFSRVPGPDEIFRTKNHGSMYGKAFLHVEARDKDSVEDILQRSKHLRNPMRKMPLPTGPEPYGTTGELFLQIKTTIVEQTCLSNQASAVLTYWAISTWFLESLPLAPCLVITGSSHEGNGVLQTLKAFCRHPFLMAGVSEASLKNINWNLDPTLLLSEPNLSKRMTALLGSSTSPGYLVGSADSYKDYFCSKAIYLGENLPIHPMPPFCVHVNAAAMSKAGTRYARPLPDAITQSFQNRLLCYRLSNLARVYNSDFDASGLHSDTRAVANALGSCIVDAPDLQTELVSLLAPHSEQCLSDRSNSLEALAVEATLSLCHQGKLQIFVRDIAEEVNRICRSRGETLQISAEKVGHTLKKVGLYTRRLGSAGKGLLIERKTQVLLHEVAAAYQSASLDPNGGNLHCPLCTETK
jgi:hypothetical protein